MYEYILFDFDGTVFDTVEGITKSVRYALNKQGLDEKPEALRSFAGPPLVEEFMARFGFSEELAQKATADFRERYNTIGLHECRVFPGMKELLTRLGQAGKRLGLATSKPQDLAELLLDREGMLGLFDSIHGGQRAGNSPKAMVVRNAMEALGADRDKTILVGDTKYDVEGAHICSIPCVGVGFGYAAPGEMERAGADAMARDMDELEAILLKK